VQKNTIQGCTRREGILIVWFYSVGRTSPVSDSFDGKIAFIPV